MPNTVSPTQALFTVFQSGLLVSGNTRITLAQQIQSGAAIMSVAVSGADEYIQLFKTPGTKLEPTTGGIFQGVVSSVIAEEIFIRRATYDVSGGASTAETVLRQRIVDSKITVASGNFASGFNLPRPYLIGENSPMPSELFSKGRLEWRFHYVL